MTQHNKAWFIKELIRLDAFATSASGLARHIGYTGKQQMYRILDDKAGEGTINEVWRRLREEYDLSDDELCAYVNVIDAAKGLWKKVRDVADGLNADAMVVAERTLHALMLREEEEMRRVIGQSEWEVLLDFSREHPRQYAQLIVIYYVCYNNIERAYGGKIAQVGVALLNDMHRHMQALQPENRMLHDMAEAYRSELSQLTGVGNLWINTLRPALLVQCFVDPDFRINVLSTLRLLPVSSESLWMESDTLSRGTGSAFIFVEVVPDGATGGRYDCIEVDAMLTDDALVPRRCFAFWMTEPDDGESTSLACLQFRDELGQKQIVRYVYEYDADRHNLHLEPLDADSPNCVTFRFPTDLHWVDTDHLMMEEERRWIAWYKRYMEANEEKLYVEMMKSDGVVMMTDCDVEDVAISRRYLTVTISRGDEVADFRVALADHPGLRLVEPQMDVVVCRHEDDQQLYLEWLSPHITVPLSAFTKCIAVEQ